MSEASQLKEFEASQLEEVVEFAENPEPRCPCVLLLDTSSSMRGARIAALNEGLRAFRDDLMQDALALRRYTEAYRYDSVGNLLELVHEAGNPGSWTRRFRYEEPSPLDPGRFNNRLTDATVGHLVEPYTYDAHGNTLTMPHVAELEWEHNDRLRRVDRGGGGNVYFL